LFVRAEQPADHPEVFQAVERAFGRPDEARLVEALRRSPAFVPELSLVAVEGDGIVGYVLFTRIVVSDGAERSEDALALAPLAVLPERQRSGIGSSLVRRGLAEARGLGHKVVIVVGHRSYYPRFGFIPGEPLGIRPPFAVSPGAFMVLGLVPDALAGVRGVVEYPPEFGRV
jgi:putative acetyltransferase